VSEIHPALARYRNEPRDETCRYPDLRAHVLALARKQRRSMSP
jgi:hypothetical protein